MNMESHASNVGTYPSKKPRRFETQEEFHMPTSSHSGAETVFPVCLLLRDRPSLVVGGGRVAAHKIRMLLEGGAEVKVISPMITDEIAQWVHEGRVRHLDREFDASDLDGVLLAFAATDDKFVNRQIVELGRERGILCCSVDGNWTAGDFVTPAVFRQDGLTVSISTGGKSCRRSRMIKDNLSRHVALMQTADLLVLGTSHEQLPVQAREPFHLIGQRLERTGEMLSQIWGVHEFMLLNTCNRVEVHAVVSRQTDVAPLLTRILGLDRLEPSQFYIKRGYEAFEHVAVLTAGLLSQTPGESQIVAQVKDALERGTKNGWARGMMQEWIATALHVSKDIRSLSAPLLRTYEIEDVCMQYVQTEYPALEEGGILVLGSGVVGMGVVRRLVEHGRKVELCYHIHRPELPASWQDLVHLFTFDDLRDRLARAELVICATDSPHYVLMAEHAPCFPEGKPVLLCDLTMPRNVDPALNGLRPNLRGVDLEDLKHWFRRERSDLDEILDLSSQTVAEHMDLYERIIWNLGNNELPSREAARSSMDGNGTPVSPSPMADIAPESALELSESRRSGTNEELVLRMKGSQQTAEVTR